MNRTFIINSLAAKIGAKSYLEIGIGYGNNFQDVLVENKVGIDPTPILNDSRILRITSDQFFSNNTQKFDIILVDGLHESPQVESDIVNSLQALNDGGWIVCHDMNPIQEQHQVVPYSGGLWNGDCWKAFVKIRANVPGIEAWTIDTDHGCAIIRKNPSVITPPPLQLPEVLTWEGLCQNRVYWLNLIGTDRFNREILNDDLTAYLYAYLGNPDDPYANMTVAFKYDSMNQWASAVSYYVRAAERTEDKQFQYAALIRASMCFDKLGTRGLSVRGLLNRAITILPKRPEAYFLLARWFEREKQVESWVNCYTNASTALEICDFDSPPLNVWVDYPGRWGLLFEKAVSAWWVGLCEEARDIFKELLTKHPLDPQHRQAVINNLSFMNQFVTKGMKNYDRTKFNRLAFKFNGIEEIERNYSEAYQDMLVLSLLNGLKGGKYVEIGAGNPFYGNNTALLETKFGWTGVAIDYDEKLVDEYNKQRSVKCRHADALKLDYEELLAPMGRDIDYLQIDIDPPDNSLAVLKKIPFNKHRFAVITFEHDAYCQLYPTVREEARQYLQSLGYRMIARNIAPDNWRNYEDWWYYPELVEAKAVSSLIDNSETTKSAESFFLRNLP